MSYSGQTLNSSRRHVRKLASLSRTNSTESELYDSLMRHDSFDTLSSPTDIVNELVPTHTTTSTKRLDGLLGSSEAIKR